MTLQQLRCFITLSQTLHYTNAARQLYLSQPSLSYAIATLENELGVKLFTKNRNSVAMTEYAEEFLPYALTAVNAIDTGFIRVKQLKNQSSFRLGYIYSISYDFFPKFLNLIPQVSGSQNIKFSFFQGQYDEIINQLKDGHLDLAFTPYSNESGITAVPIFSQEIFLVLSKLHPLASKSTIELKDLSDQKFALLNNKTNLRQIINESLQEHNFVPDISFEAGDCNSAATFVASEYGVSLLPHISPLDVYNLKFTRIRDVEISRTIFLAWKTNGPAESLGQSIVPYLQSLFSAS